MTDLIILALAAWQITYQVVFGQLGESLRTKLNIGYDYDDQNYAVDRWAVGAIGNFVNCHSCISLLSALLVILIWYLGGRIICQALAVMAGASLLGRWWMSQRIRREWWL